LRIFIFVSIHRQNSEIEIPELIQQTAQGGLIGKMANQQRFAILLREDADIAKPIGRGSIQGFFDPDPICVFDFRAILAHGFALSQFLNEIFTNMLAVK
jgi:hypothetical protein